MQEDSGEIKEMYDKFMGSNGETLAVNNSRTKSKLHDGSAGTSSLLRYDDGSQP